MAAYRFKYTCLGIGALEGRDEKLVTFSNSAHDEGQMRFILPAATAADFTIGSTYNFYISLTGGDNTSIEGAVTVKKGRSQE